MPRADPKKKLGTYRAKRSPGVTNEPFGDEGAAGAPQKTLIGAYVVQVHDATRLHYDFRFEVGGVLASFAVPRGPSLDPHEKHLAVRTEDHPLEYLEFEDVIPDAQYGAGPMIVWDRGVVEYLEGPAEDELENGKLHVELRGMKLRGRWAFVKIAKPRGKDKGNEWLVFKKEDEHANPRRDLTTLLPRSVLSGLTVKELGERDRIARDREARVLALGASTLAKSAIFAPAPIADGDVSGAGLVYDADLDGVRVLATRRGDVVTMVRVRGDANERIEAFYPDVVRALRALPDACVVLDGQLVAFDRSGRPSQSLLAERADAITRGDLHRAVTQTPVVLVATDVLALGDADLRALPLSKRRPVLDALFPDVGFLRASTLLEGAQAEVLARCAELDLGAVIARKKSGAYAAKGIRISTGVPPRSRREVEHHATTRRVTVSNRTKVFWPAPGEGYTKGDLCDYYAAVSEVLLPFLAERPVILVRYPDGIEGKNFFQWNVPVGMPAWVRTLTFSEGDHTRRGFLVDDVSTLVYLANLACIPVHILAGRLGSIREADFLTMDFDIKQSELRHAVTLARTLRKILDEIGLPGFPKTSGQTGLHVLVPLGPGQSFDTARALAELLGRLLVERHPEIATMERVVARRGPKVYVDTGQTGQTRAIVAPYSVRAVSGARVSTPLEWDEVKPSLDPGAFTMKTVPKRIAKRGDPMKTLLSARPDVPGAVTRMAELLRRP